jgi:hypothetical protein
MHRISQLLISLSLVLALASTTGCASKVVDAAATKLKAGNIEIQLPKNLDADELEVSINPKTGEYKLTAKKLKTDASGVIDSASKIQAEALGKLADTVTALAPLVK